MYFLHQYSTVQYSTVQYSTVDPDTMHQLHHETMPTVLLHSAGHCEHKITWIYQIDNFPKKNN